jgi:protein SCO1/2
MRETLRLTGILGILLSLLWIQGVCSEGQPRLKAGEVPEVGVEEHVGTTMPLELQLTTEEGERVRFGELLDRPTILLFVYFRCPAICRPMMTELARALRGIRDLEPGKDYRVVSVSFDPTDTPEIARTTRNEIVKAMGRPLEPGAWRFLVGEEEVVRRLTEAAGFKYAYDPETQTYLHASSLIFLTREGRIVRYIGGLEYLSSQVKMAILDAMEGRERSFMQALERICYAYDPQGKKYVLRLYRVILGVTGLLGGGIVAFLFLGRRRGARRGEAA